MIKPTVGRVVWYRPSDADQNVMTIHDAQPLAAIVAYVWSDTMVNLTVSDHGGNTHSRTSVDLAQDSEQLLASPYCEWMPYQKGQAAKSEQLEQKLGASS
jgi:hypothetical protein